MSLLDKPRQSKTRSKPKQMVKRRSAPPSQLKNQTMTLIEPQNKIKDSTSNNSTGDVLDLIFDNNSNDDSNPFDLFGSSNGGSNSTKSANNNDNNNNNSTAMDRPDFRKAASNPFEYGNNTSSMTMFNPSNTGTLGHPTELALSKSAEWEDNDFFGNDNPFDNTPISSKLLESSGKGKRQSHAVGHAYQDSHAVPDQWLDFDMFEMEHQPSQEQKNDNNNNSNNNNDNIEDTKHDDSDNNNNNEKTKKNNKNHNKSNDKSNDNDRNSTPKHHKHKKDKKRHSKSGATTDDKNNNNNEKNTDKKDKATNKDKDKDKDTKEKDKDSKSKDKKEKSKGSNALDELHRGSALLKYPRRSGFPHFKHVQLSLDNTRVQWYSKRKALDETCILIKDIREVVQGQKTEVFKKFQQKTLEKSSFSLVYGMDYKTLDVAAKSIDECQMWVRSVKKLHDLAKKGTKLTELKELYVGITFKDRNRPRSRQGSGNFIRANTSKSLKIDPEALKEIEKDMDTLKKNYQKISTMTQKPSMQKSEEYLNIQRVLSEIEERMEELEYEVSNIRDTELAKREVWRANVDLNAMMEKVEVLSKLADRRKSNLF